MDGVGMYDKHVRRVGEDERERASLTATPQNLTGRAGLLHNTATI